MQKKNISINSTPDGPGSLNGVDFDLDRDKGIQIENFKKK